MINKIIASYFDGESLGVIPLGPIEIVQASKADDTATNTSIVQQFVAIIMKSIIHNLLNKITSKFCRIDLEEDPNQLNLPI